MSFHHVTPAEADAAYEAWGCNCGPSALAAIMGMTLDSVRPLLPGFDEKRYTNPSMMNTALRAIGRPWRKIGAAWPRYGLARIQWEGPWTEPGVPMAARYRHTHWVGSWLTKSSHGVWDVNMLANGTGWGRFEHWRDILVPHLTAHIPRANGRWHVTHGIEIEWSEMPISRAPATTTPATAHLCAE